MSNGLEYVAAVPLALGAAACFGAAGLLQHQAARAAPESGSLLLNLLHVPLFRWGLVLSVGAFGMQVAALSLAPLALVQPLLITGVLFYLGYATVFLHHAPDRQLFAGAALAVVGLSMFLLAADPAPGQGRFDGSAALPLGLALAVTVGCCLAVAPRLPGELRVIPTAAATAVCYGVTAGLLRSVLSPFDPATLFQRWELYVVLVVAPAGFLLNQHAFQEGSVGSVAVAIITVGDPVVSISVGAAWLGESLAGGTTNTILQVLALMVMAAGVAVLATRAQRVADRLRSSDLSQHAGRS